MRGLIRAFALLTLLAPALYGQTPNFDTGTYQYDGAGNIVKMGTDVYTYDGVGRLSTASLANHTQAFEYDSFGNITKITTDGNQATVMVPGVNRATNRASETTGGATNFGTYDAAGNMVTYLGAYNYAYDGMGMMTEATGPAGQHDLYIYTADNERIAVVNVGGSAAGAPITGYHWSIRGLDNKVLRAIDESVDGVGNRSFMWKEDYIYAGSSLLAAENSSPDHTLHFFTDHLGTPRLITGSGGAVIFKHTYYPFGQELTTSTDTEVMKFTGHERDASLDYMHARFTNWGMGRFLSVDPANAQPDSPQAWNRYSYVRNDPLSRIDSDGRADFETHVKNIASALGFHWWNDSNARLAYNAAKGSLIQGAEGAPAARTAAKIAARQLSTPAGAKLAEIMRPMKDEAARVGGSVAKGNTAVDAAFVSNVGRAAGPLVVAASLSVSIINIANAPEGQRCRTMAGEAGGVLGSVVFGEAGAVVGTTAGGAAGAAFGGGGAVPGAAIGGLAGLVSGGIVGGQLGEKAALNLYDALVPTDGGSLPVKDWQTPLDKAPATH